MTALVLLLAVYAFSSFSLPQRLTAQDLEDAVASALASASPSPPPGVAIHAQLKPSLVRVSAWHLTSGRAERSSATGVVIDLAGTLLTSLHVVDGAVDLMVTFSDGTESEVVVVGTLPERDIAALRATNLPAIVVPAILGDPRSVEVGDEAFVIGNPFGLERSLSAGVISGLDRTFTIPSRKEPITGLIQFDAAVNPGSSGGALTDRRGDVVGIVTGLVNPGGGTSFSGVGFAVPIDAAASAAGQPPY
jgi:S1-C subfamily serine protease